MYLIHEKCHGELFLATPECSFIENGPLFYYDIYAVTENPDDVLGELFYPESLTHGFPHRGFRTCFEDFVLDELTIQKECIADYYAIKNEAIEIDTSIIPHVETVNTFRKMTIPVYLTSELGRYHTTLLEANRHNTTVKFNTFYVADHNPYCVCRVSDNPF